MTLVCLTEAYLCWDPISYSMACARREGQFRRSEHPHGRGYSGHDHCQGRDEDHSEERYPDDDRDFRFCLGAAHDNLDDGEAQEVGVAEEGFAAGAAVRTIDAASVIAVAAAAAAAIADAAVALAFAAAGVLQFPGAAVPILEGSRPYPVLGAANGVELMIGPAPIHRSILGCGL